MNHEMWMQMAIDAAAQGIAEGQTPFGAAIVQGDKLVAAGHNEVWHRCDPTAHAEVVTIQKAAEALQSIDLTGCVMYTTCEPCPMCAAAIHWSKLDEVYFGATIADAQKAGFNELIVPAKDLYKQGGSHVLIHDGLLNAECAALFEQWKTGPAMKSY
jgi:tRNA(Arg) A34 adenosine deaminase TadA